MDVKFHFVKQKSAEGIIDIKYICTQKQQADMLTKPLSKRVFKLAIPRLGLQSHVGPLKEK